LIHSRPRAFASSLLWADLSFNPAMFVFRN
jgi:hypothetical protein